MHIANTGVTLCDGRRMKTIKLDEKATLRNPYNPIPHPVLDTKMGQENINLDSINMNSKRLSQEEMATRLS